MRKGTYCIFKYLAEREGSIVFFGTSQRASRELFGYREERQASVLGTSQRAACKARVSYFWVPRNKVMQTSIVMTKKD